MRGDACDFSRLVLAQEKAHVLTKHLRLFIEQLRCKHLGIGRHAPAQLEQCADFIGGHGGSASSPSPKGRDIAAAKVVVCETPARQICVIHLVGIQHLSLGAHEIAIVLVLHSQFDGGLCIVAIQLQRRLQQRFSMKGIELSETHVVGPSARRNTNCIAD